MTGNFGNPQVILLIEDNPADARLIEEMVSEVNQMRDTALSRFEIVWKSNLRDGLERLREPGIDLVLLDLTLPDSQGMETFTKTLEDAARVPVILLTGFSNEELAMVAVRSGAQDYLQKTGLTGFYLAKAMRYAMERKAAEEEIKLLSQKILAVREEERAGLAHELHDGLGQSLLALKLQMQSKFARIEKQSGLPVSAEMESIVAYLDGILQEVRNISHSLSPISLKNLGFAQAIRQLVHRFQEQDQTEVTLELDSLEGFFPEDWDMNAYRIVEQALVNSMKHADATRIEITGRRSENSLTLSVKDNGQGMDVGPSFAKVRESPGLGLHIMRERARILGGSLHILTGPNAGTEIRLELNRTP